MKILITVGTTRFDRLIALVASESFFREHECKAQVGLGGPNYGYFECFEYAENIDEFYSWADVVITHAGAGSIYRLLELKKRLVVVPNTDRVDPHQLDIASFMHINGYVRTASELNSTVECVLVAYENPIKVFRKEAFFAASEIVDFIDS